MLRLSINNLIRQTGNSIYKQPPYQFSQLFKSDQKPTSRHLDKYDIIIIGCNLGGILSQHIEKATKGKYKIMVVYDQNHNQLQQYRSLYELNKITKQQYNLQAKLTLNSHSANTDQIGVESILPHKNQIVLRNGRKIQYDQLVIAMGLNEDINKIQGLEDAWKDEQHPVYLYKDPEQSISFKQKQVSWFNNFTGGNAFFVIPPYPFKGEIGAYNFFLARQLWNQMLYEGRLSPRHTFTIINANQKFIQWLESADNFIKERIAKSGISIEYNTELIKIDKTTKTATFKQIDSEEQQTKSYNNLYIIPPCTPHNCLLSSNLVNEQTNNLLDVDQQTLQHKHFKNIFGLGDICNIPTTKSYYSGLQQIRVVRNNIIAQLQGQQQLNSFYNGYSKCNLFIGKNQMTSVIHYYNNKESWLNLIDQSGGYISILRYLYYSKIQLYVYYAQYKGFIVGSPYYFVVPQSHSNKENSPKFTENYQETQGIKSQQYQAINKNQKNHNNTSSV